MSVSLVNARVLLEDGSVEKTEILIEDGKIRAIGSGAATGHAVDLDNKLVLPGIIDLHGDGFERSLMPRIGTRFPIDIALLDADRAILSSGITTAFLAQGVSWEGGIRGSKTAEETLTAIERGQKRFGADLRFHLRFETFAIEEQETAMRWLEDGRVSMLVFNDHLPQFERSLRETPDKMRRWAHHLGIAFDDFRAQVSTRRAREDKAEETVRQIASLAQKLGVPTGSHDDNTPALRQKYNALGARIAEFPVNLETAKAARALGNPVGMGAPNALRGGSASGNISARSVIEEGLCDYLISDYYYPAQFHAAFKLATDGVLTLGAAWTLVSAGPAKVGGLDDRGVIAVGKRADIIVVDDSDKALPTVDFAIVKGALSYASEPFRVAAVPELSSV